MRRVTEDPSLAHRPPRQGPANKQIGNRRLTEDPRPIPRTREGSAFFAFWPAREAPVKVKDGSVVVTELHPAMHLVIEVLDDVAQSYGLPEIVITSGRDGQHMVGSKHGAGEAVDARLSEFLGQIAQRVRQRLDAHRPRTYDVVLELTPTTCTRCGATLRGTHLHVEFDPK